MKKYRVKNEYWDMWSVSNDEEAIVDLSEIERLADEWEKTVDELLEQCEEYHTMIEFLNQHSEELFSGKKITYCGKVYWANMTTLEIYAMPEDATLSGVINGYKVAEIMNDFVDRTWEIVEVAD